MKNLAITLAAALVALTSTAAFIPQANQAWVTNKIDEVVGTNTAARIAAVAQAATNYTDSAISAAGSVTPLVVTNIAGAVVTNVVPSWARNANPPEGMSGNAVVWTNNSVVTRDGSKTIGAAELNTYPIGGTVFSNDVAAIVTQTNIVGFTEWNRYHVGGLDIYLVWMDMTSTWWMKYDDGMGGAMFDTGAGADAVYATRDRYEFHRRKLNGENALGLARLVDIPTVEPIAGAVATNVVRSINGGVWDAALQVWWTPVMSNGKLTYQATTNVNLNAGN